MTVTFEYLLTGWFSAVSLALSAESDLPLSEIILG